MILRVEKLDDPMYEEVRYHSDGKEDYIKRKGGKYMCSCGSDKRVGFLRCCESLNLRQLYEVYVSNGQEYEDESHFTELIVARNENEARELVKKKRDFKFHDTEDTRIWILEIDEIDGYRVKLEKI